MKIKLNYILPLLLIISYICFPQQKKFLFDNTHAETAGNADWVISEVSNVAGRYPSPDQSTVTSSTSETYWTGALSSWGIALVKLGHSVETLPGGSSITYGTSNAQDLKNYDVFVVDEPNTLFTATEKTALINFVQNGGGLFMISDHTVSDRNNDGYDSPMIWNDLFTNNGIVSNPFGMAVDLTNISLTSTNIAAGDYLITGSAGIVTAMKWNNGATATINKTANSTVTGVVWTSGITQGNTSLMVARAKYGKGRVVLVCDSSPADDGSGASGNTLYQGWLDPLVNGSHAALHLNGSLWLSRILEPDPLPVELVSFSAILSNRSINLSWKTATEVNNMGFNIERSANKSEWAVIAFVQGNQNSTSAISYSYNDRSVNQSGSYYYRLKQIDNDGSFKYSNIVEADVSSPSVFTLYQNYPNPFNPSTVISYSIPEASNVKLIVYNAIGQPVRILENGFKNTGTYKVSFNASELSSGIYFYKIEAGHVSQIKKMMLIK